ncbi:MAG TPA: PIG-L family deacetylase [Burkholderiaceae bacterium]|nr:PIG-L family deacetylase [Burkholderiaceae bacterium]
MLVISPHLDDAALSCGEFLCANPGAVVVTLFAGTPRNGDLRTDWDGRCGFASATEAVWTRRAEDAHALDLLGAAPQWLDFCDDQYDEQVSLASLVLAIGTLLDHHPDSPVLFPIGLFHSDHRLAHRAVVLALADRPGRQTLVYEDVPYRAMVGALQGRLSELHAQGIVATPHPRMTDWRAAAPKARAVAAYASQLRAFGRAGIPDAWRPERIWELRRLGRDQ